METTDLNKLAEILNESGLYKVAQKYQKLDFYNTSDDSDKLIGVFLDIESTGLAYDKDKLIELGMVKFEYNKDGRIFRILDEFGGYQDPHIPIPGHITALTGISDDMVKGQQIDESTVASYLDDVDIIIAHNAQFDRSFFETTFPSIRPKAWGCSMCDIDWKIEGISSHKLEYIAYKYNFFYEGHRAVIDSLAGIHILAQDLPNSKQSVLKQVLTSALATRFKLWAVNAPYDRKDILKMRGYWWSDHKILNYKAWSIELTEDKIEDEINYLRSNIYGGSAINIPIEVFDAYTRFSNRNTSSQDSMQYQDKLEWAKSLCLG